MEILKIESFNIIGVSVRTSNLNNKAAQDIGALWAKFIGENIVEKIPGKSDYSIYSIYTNYEGDHTKPYDTILGCRVDSLDIIPEGMVGLRVPGGLFTKYISIGDVTKGSVYNTWLEIWNSDLNRAFKADFEVYGEKSRNPENAEVEIFIGLKE